MVELVSFYEKVIKVLTFLGHFRNRTEAARQAYERQPYDKGPLAGPSMGRSQKTEEYAVWVVSSTRSQNSWA